MERYHIGDMCLNWDCEGYEFVRGTYFDLFKNDSSEGMDVIHFEGKFEDLEKYTEYNKIMEDNSYELYEVDNEKLMIYHWAKTKHAFAIWPDRINSNKINTCYFNHSLKNDYSMNADWFFGLCGLHRALLQKRAPILHASYIDYDGRAILFAAPSQTGKSTQANLWEEYAGAEIINGDRVLLRKKDGIWNAYGYPCCGSSKICINRTLPIAAIVILKQGSENRVIPMEASDKIRSLVAGIEVYRWDLEEVEQSLDVAQEIISEVPVVQLVCRPDADAVRVLKEYLEA